jgi:uncharacterized membrane protein
VGRRAAPMACVLGLVLSCGEPAGDTACDASALSYQTFGEPFLASWCRGCHSSEVPPEMRQRAPLEVNFNSRAEVQAFIKRIGSLVAASAMPPAGGPSGQERALLAEWIECGAR